MRPRLRVLLAPAALAALWLLAVVVGAGSRAVPTPAALFRTSYAELTSAALWLDAAATLARVLCGVVGGAVLATALGLLLGRRRATWAAVEPTVDFVRAVPPILIFPVFLLAFGYGESARIATIAAGSGTIVLLQIAAGLARAPAARRDTVRLAGLHGWSTFSHLYFFETLAPLLLGLRLAVQAGLIIAVVSEMLIGASRGLGARALAAQISYRPDLLWLAIAMAGLLGATLSSALSRLERRVVHW